MQAHTAARLLCAVLIGLLSLPLFAGEGPRPNRPARPDRPDRPERPARPDRPNQPERPDRPDRPERPDRPDRPGDELDLLLDAEFGFGGVGGGGFIQKLLDHKVELNLTADQEAQLIAVRERVRNAMEILRTDEEFRALRQQLRAAQGNPEEVRRLRAQLHALIEQKTGIAPGTIRAEITAILTPEQLARAKELFRGARGAGGPRPNGPRGAQDKGPRDAQNKGQREGRKAPRAGGAFPEDGQL